LIYKGILDKVTVFQFFKNFEVSHFEGYWEADDING